jgi:hypothetical protein
MAVAITVLAHTMAVATTTMADTIGEATHPEPSSDTTDSADRNGIFLLAEAVVVRGITPSKMDCANRIRIAAPTTETLVESHFRLADVRYWPSATVTLRVPRRVQQ